MTTTLNLILAGQMLDGSDVLDTISQKTYSITQTDEGIWRAVIAPASGVEADLDIPLPSIAYIVAVNRGTVPVRIGPSDAGTLVPFLILDPGRFAVLPSLDTAVVISHEGVGGVGAVDFRAFSE